MYVCDFIQVKIQIWAFAQMLENIFSMQKHKKMLHESWAIF
jgi:hypothetical protein